jgi:hypothetical protein
VNATPSIASPSGTVIYNEDFSAGSGGWHYYLLANSPPANAEFCISYASYGYSLLCMVRGGWTAPGVIESHSPWFLDPNHASPGAGNLNLLGFVFLNGRHGGLPQPTIDLRNGRLSARVYADSLALNGGHVYFWFQTYVPSLGKWANFALTSSPLESRLKDKQWVTIDLTLKNSAADWTCLGSSLARQDTYGCVGVTRALGNVNTNFGFIVLPVDPSRPATGTVRFDSVSIRT